MSSASDQVVFQESVEGQDHSNLFQSKKWTYITDASSTGGTFNGQLQFDLNTLSSQNQWTDLSQAYIQFPVKLSIKNNNAVAFSAGSVAVTSATLKNGFHQFVDSVQVTIGGSTIQSSQIFTNIDTQYKILSEWSQDELRKYGPSLGIALDDYLVSSDSNVGYQDTLDNAALTTAIQGFDMTYSKNPGFKDRLSMFNNYASTSGITTTSHLGKSILGDNQSVIGKSNVDVDATVATAGNDIFVLYALGTIRLKDISDALSKMPLVKGLKGFIYVNYNAGSTVVSNTGGAATVTTFTPSMQFGRCMPGMLNLGADGLIFGTGATATPVTFTAEISGTPSNLTTAKTITQNARLVAPYYVATPEVDRALTTKKTIRYNERFVTQFNIGDTSQVNLTLTPGISNPKRVILYPYFTGAGSSGNSGFLTNPLISPSDSAPATTSPFAALKDLQLYVGNVPMFQSPITIDYDTFLNEVAQQGLDGGLVDQQASGLLSQRLWNQLYRFYTCDIGRRMGSEDGCSKSVQVQCSNATKCPVTVIAIIWYEREITVDTASGQITQGM